jgi:hypothetical protein
MTDPTEIRLALYRDFERRFREPDHFPAPDPPTPVDPAEIDAAERQLGCPFPFSYRVFVAAVGPCDVRGLQDAWLHSRVRKSGDDAVPVPFTDLWHPATIVRQCRDEWWAPIPAALAGGTAVDSGVAWKYLIPFAGDGLGNWHCFPRPATTLAPDDLPVFYFDHDGGDIEPLASGLDDLLRQYLRLPG